MIELGRILIEEDNSSNKVDLFDRLLKGELRNIGEVLLYRGSSKHAVTYSRHTTHDDRRAKDTPKHIIDMVNTIAINDGYIGKGYLLRNNNILFATVRKNVAEYYGGLNYIFVPKDDYKVNFTTFDPTSSYFNDFEAIASSIAMSWYEFGSYKDIDMNFDIIIQLFKSSGFDIPVDGFNISHSFREFFIMMLKEFDGLSDFQVMKDQLAAIIGKINKLDFDNVDLKNSYLSILRMLFGKYALYGDKLKQYFDNVRVYTEEDYVLPWKVRCDDDLVIYEYIIQTPYYYSVNKLWFDNNFIYDDGIKGYRKK